ncbi:uncharacterized protein LOC125728538 isoform X1 [Brienomyrus brachyistius]|uniref:uncharacterized protein LOC125728538 isoform X1 n=1 Tax=Brienomyrus brachyistius TaxID=42636 RepID=UPI0020B44AA5|nr:uncharacterized protein LOC125728538 isoform X1 [Brienomyrus brachyistius]
MTSPLKPFNSVDLYSTPRRISGFSKDRIPRRTLSKLASKENERTVESYFIPKTRPRSVTPMISKTQANLISNLETCNRSTDKAVSPNLAMLRMTPGPSLQERQKLLQQKHQRAKESVDRLAVGGGVSLWPEMDSMRLSAEEGVVLGLLCVVVTFATCYLFKYLHGSLLHSMRRYTATVDGFPAAHPILRASQAALDHSLLAWHTHFLQRLDEIKKQFETHLTKAHTAYLMYLVLYVSAIGTLLYYLIDNVIQKSKLTPRRIKVWVLLLVATASWTLLMFHLLVSYQRLEQSIEETVWRLLDERAHLATMDLNLKMYRNVATYWKEHCLPPLSRGTLSVFGLVPVRDIFFYLQYYSVPILTALCTPILKLLVTLKEMYIDPHRVHPRPRALSCW